MANVAIFQEGAIVFRRMSLGGEARPYPLRYAFTALHSPMHIIYIYIYIYRYILLKGPKR